MSKYPFISNTATMSLYPKNVLFKPNTTYALSMDVLGGAMELWFHYDIDEHTLEYFPPSDVWTTHQFVFTTSELINHLIDWSFSFVKCAWPYHAYEGTYSATYVDNVQLINVATGENLLPYGDFEQPLESAVYDTQWRPSILHGNDCINVSIVPDPLSPENHCLRFPEVINTLSYPKPFPVQARNFGRFFDIERNVRCIEFYGRAYPRFLVAVRGSITVEINDITFEVPEGHLTLLPANTPYHYTYHAGKDTLYYWLSFDGEYSCEMIAALGLDKPLPLKLPNLESLTATIDKMLMHPFGSSTYYCAVSGYLQLVFAELEQQITPKKINPRYNALIQASAERIQYNPEKTPNNKTLAEECGISESYFIRLFKQIMGVTPQQYRLRSLVRIAGTMLTETQLTVQEITYRLNIDDPLYFSRLFKSIQGVSPSEYRKQQKQTPTI